MSESTIGKPNGILSKEIGLHYYHLLLLPVLLLFPILLWRLDLPVVFNTYGPRQVVFELFGFLTSTVVLLHAGVQIRKRWGSPIMDFLPLLSFTLFCLFFTAQVTEYRPQSPDWLCYERAARALRDGFSPYADGCYLYPPLPSVALAALYGIVEAGSQVLAIPVDPGFIWEGVYYFYQSTQFFLLAFAFLLCYRLLRNLDAGTAFASCVLIILFTFNIPILRTLYHHQINLWVLTLILVVLLTYQKFPLQGGAALALAISLKLYPVILLIPLFIMRKFRMIGWTGLGVIILLLIQSGWGTDFSTIQGFIDRLGSFPTGIAFRDNSIQSLAHNTLAGLGFLFSVETGTIATLEVVSVWLIRCAVVTGIVIICLSGRKSNDQVGSGTAQVSLLSAVIASGLLISPMVWEHHFVLVIPLMSIAVALHFAKNPYAVLAIFLLIFALPVFDVYPFSYHRLLGLLALLFLFFRPPRMTVK